MKKNIHLLILILCVCACERSSDFKNEGESKFVWADEGKDQSEWDGTPLGRVESLMQNGVDPCEKFPQHNECEGELIPSH